MNCLFKLPRLKIFIMKIIVVIFPEFYTNAFFHPLCSKLLIAILFIFLPESTLVRPPLTLNMNHTTKPNTATEKIDPAKTYFCFFDNPMSKYNKIYLKVNLFTIFFINNIIPVTIPVIGHVSRIDKHLNTFIVAIIMKICIRIITVGILHIYPERKLLNN